MKIHLGSDHAGFELKEQIIRYLKEGGYEAVDHGTYSADSVDYPDYAHRVAEAVETDLSRGILVCGSGNGVAMAANKHQGIRAALCWSEEIARLARQHNDANIICVPARFMPVSEALSMIGLFLNTGFEGGRHQQRVSKIACS